MAKSKAKSTAKSPEKEVFELKTKSVKELFELDIKRHEMRMDELRFMRETDKHRHELELERQRIKSAEIRRDREWRSNQKFASSYAN